MTLSEKLVTIDNSYILYIGKLANKGKKLKTNPNDMYYVTVYDILKTYQEEDDNPTPTTKFSYVPRFYIDELEKLNPESPINILNNGDERWIVYLYKQSDVFNKFTYLKVGHVSYRVICRYLSIMGFTMVMVGSSSLEKKICAFESYPFLLSVKTDFRLCNKFTIFYPYHNKWARTNKTSILFKDNMENILGTNTLQIPNEKIPYKEFFQISSYDEIFEDPNKIKEASTILHDELYRYIDFSK